MLKTLLPCCALALFSLTAPQLNLQLPGMGSQPEAAQVLMLGERPLASIMPADSILYLDAPGLGEILEQGLEHPFVASLLGSELGVTLLDTDAVDLGQKLMFIDAIFGEPVLAAFQELSSQGLAFSLGVRGEEPTFLAALRGTKSTRTQKILDRIFKLLEPTGFNSRPERFAGAQLWLLDKGAVLVKHDELLLVASSKALAREALDLSRAQKPAGLAANSAFAESMDRAATEGTLRAWVDGKALAAADPGKYEWMDLLQHTPEGQLLLGAGISTLMGSEVLGMGLDLSAGDLDFKIWGNDLEWPAPLGMQHAGDGFSKPAALQLENTLGQALLYRDLETFLAQRPTLVRPRDLPGISEALSTIALFFGGLDFGEEISPNLSPWIQVISTELDYQAGPNPIVKFPGVALVTELKHPETSGPRWNTAFQSLIGMLNIDAAQKKGGRGSMLLGLSLEGDTVLSHASYPEPAEGDPVDARYNLRPTCCVVDGRLVIGSHEDLVRQIVRSIKAESKTGRAATRTSVETLSLKAQPVARLLQENFDTLVMNKVVDEGIDFEEATEDTKGLILAAQSLQALRISVDYADPSSIVAHLHLDLKSSKGEQ